MAERWFGEDSSKRSIDAKRRQRSKSPPMGLPDGSGLVRRRSVQGQVSAVTPKFRCSIGASQQLGGLGVVAVDELLGGHAALTFDLDFL